MELLEAKARIAGIVAAIASVPTWILGNAGVPIIFGESICWLIRLCVDVEGSQERLIEAKIERVAVISAVSLYESKIKGIQGRLDRLLRNISSRERELEIVPAFMACQEILALFRDTKYPFWNKPEISAPFLVSFAGIYVAVCGMTVELMESYRPDVAKEIGILGSVVDDYRRRFLCFRLSQPKYPIFSRKDMIDKYDEKHRTTQRLIITKQFDCFCLHKQAYIIELGRIYGSFFDSVKAAIVESNLLPVGETPKSEWCTEHEQCYTVFKPQKSCFCKNWNQEERYLSIKAFCLEKVLEGGQCLLTVSQTNSCVRHYQYICRTCQDSQCICRSCKLTCHKGHDVAFVQYDWFSCNCANNSSKTKCKLKDAVAVAGDTTESTTSPIVCDKCDKNIKDERYKCIICNDYDLCKICITEQVHTSHDFMQVLNTSDTVRRSYVHRFVYCNTCKESPLCGIRYKCTQCEDYNVCTSCFDVKVHEHNTFKSMSPSRRYSNNNRSSWSGLVEAMKNAQLLTSKASDTDCEKCEYCNGDSDVFRCEEDDLKKACILFERNPKMPVVETLTCEQKTVSYVININGRISPNPHRFEVNIWLKDKIVLNFNPRWDQEKTVLNTFDKEWGRKQFAFFDSLVPNAEFRLNIVYTDTGYEITMNDEEPVHFAHRITDVQLELLLEVKGDVIPELVTFDLYNST